MAKANKRKYNYITHSVASQIKCKKPSKDTVCFERWLKISFEMVDKNTSGMYLWDRGLRPYKSKSRH